MKKNILRSATITGLILLTPLVLTLFGSGVDEEGFHWTLGDFVLMGAVIFGVTMAYELLVKKSEKIVYRAALAVGLGGAFLLFWVNGAVGIIGDSSINLLYGGVFIVGLIGSVAANFKPQGMAYTLFVAAFVQMMVPVIALIVRTPDLRPGVLHIFVLNAGFATLFVVSGLLFRRAANEHNQSGV